MHNKSSYIGNLLSVERTHAIESWPTTKIKTIYKEICCSLVNVFDVSTVTEFFWVGFLNFLYAFQRIVTDQLAQFFNANFIEFEFLLFFFEDK
jgi:hypothetical protein